MEKVKNLYRTARAQNDSINTSEQIRTTLARRSARRRRGNQNANAKQGGTEYAGQGPGPRRHRIRPSRRARRSAGQERPPRMQPAGARRVDVGAIGALPEMS